MELSKIIEKKNVPKFISSILSIDRRTLKPIILPNECQSLLFVDETKLYFLFLKHPIDKQSLLLERQLVKV